MDFYCVGCKHPNSPLKLGDDIWWANTHFGIMSDSQAIEAEMSFQESYTFNDKPAAEEDQGQPWRISGVPRLSAIEISAPVVLPSLTRAMLNLFVRNLKLVDGYISMRETDPHFIKCEVLMQWASTGKKTKDAQVKASQKKGWNRNKGVFFFLILFLSVCYPL